MPPKSIRHIAIKRLAVSVAISAGVGLLLLTAHPLAVAATCMLPTIWLLQRDRVTAYLCTCSYYATAIGPVISIVHGFDGSRALGCLIWAGGFTVLSLPWLVFHSVDPNKTIWCAVMASLASIVPPLGLIGVACPISAAGLLFPGCKILGLLAACALPGLLTWKPKPAFLLASAAILLTNLRYATQAPQSPNWEAVDTVADPTPGAFGDYRRIEAMLDRAESSSAKVIIFPEATIRSWTPTTLAFFDDRIRWLGEKGKTVLTGAIIPEPNGFRNVVEAFGSTTAVFEQRVPVPLGMWHPLAKGGVQLHPLGASGLRVAGQNAAILICYEQLIPWPALTSMLHHPSMLIGIANGHWVRETPIATVQSAYARAWSRMLSVPVILSVAR